MKLQFNLKYKDDKTMARLGEITYNGKTYETPMFMPVGTNATVKTLSPEELKSIGFDLGVEEGDKSVSIENPLFPDFVLSEPGVENNDFNGLDKSEINHRVAKAFNVIRGTDLNEDDIHFLRQLIDSVTSHYWDRK